MNCGRVADEVDHHTPLSRGGEVYDEANLRSLCRKCHREKSAEENTYRSTSVDGIPKWRVRGGNIPITRGRRDHRRGIEYYGKVG